MTTMPRLLPAIALVALALSACSAQAPDPAPEASSSDSQMAPGSGVHADAAPAASHIPVPASGIPSRAVQSPLEKTIPQEARGRWGLVPADCTTTRGDDKGLITIAATRIKFYESIADLDLVKERTESRIRAIYSYEGEGMNWTRETMLDVQDDGKTLILREYGDDAPAGPRKYRRCG